jgi:hypothetical protein
VDAVSKEFAEIAMPVLRKTDARTGEVLILDDGVVQSVPPHVFEAHGISQAEAPFPNLAATGGAGRVEIFVHPRDLT